MSELINGEDYNIKINGNWYQATWYAAPYNSFCFPDGVTRVRGNVTEYKRMYFPSRFVSGGE